MGKYDCDLILKCYDDGKLIKDTVTKQPIELFKDCMRCFHQLMENALHRAAITRRLGNITIEIRYDT